MAESARAPQHSPIVAVAAGILIFVAGLVVGVWGFEQWRAEQDRLAISARADGTVTGELNGHPMISFSLQTGDRVTFTARNVSRDAYPVGKRVDILYRVDLPSDAVLDRPHARWARHGLVALGALALMAFGGYLSWYARNYDMRSWKS